MSITISSPIPERGIRRYARARALLVVAVVLTAVLLRFVALDRYPLPLHQDELSNIYDGYSLATTGADRSGARWPILLRAMGPGDYRPALYAYLASITTGACGFSTWAGRIPAAVVGVLTVILIFLFSRRLLGANGGLIALLFAAFSPILIQYSRQAHEGACLPPFFAILTVYLLYRAIEPPRHAVIHYDRAIPGGARLFWLALAGLAVGLSTSAYGAQRLTGPLFTALGVVLLLWQIGWRQSLPRRAGSCMLVFSCAACVGALPQIFAMIDQPEEFFARATYVGHDWQSGPRWWAHTLISGYAAHLNPRQLFFSAGDYAHLTVVRLSVVALPFLYLGLAVAMWRIIWRREPADVLLLSAVVISILPAAATKGEPSIIRASGVWALYPVICTLGATTLGSILQKGLHRLVVAATQRREACAGLATVLLSVAIVAVGVGNVSEYLAHPEWQDAAGQNHLVRIGEWLKNRSDGYERVYVDVPGHFPHLYVAAFAGVSPREFQGLPWEGTITPTGWDSIQRFGKFYFADLSRVEADWAASDRDESWLYVNVDGRTVTFASTGVHRGHHELALAPSPRGVDRPATPRDR